MKNLRERNFSKLIGVKIVDVDASAINELVLIDSKGNRFHVSAEPDGPLGIPVMYFSEERKVK